MLRRVTDVLLCADESPASLAATRALWAAGHRPLVAVSREDTYAARSRAATGVAHVPDAQRDGLEECARGIAAAASRHGVAAVLPGTEGTLRALTGRERLFRPGVAIGTTDEETLDLATDKVTLQRVAAEAGLDTLPAVVITPGELEQQATRLPLPAVVKPVRSVDPRSNGRVETVQIAIADDIAAVRRCLQGAHPESRWIVQRRVEGTLAAIGGVAWEGEVVSATHQVSPRIWPVERGISSYAVTVAADPEREAGVARMLRAIGWSGVFGVQFLLTGAAAYVIDLNPRIYGSVGLAVAAGHNLPAIWLDLLLGRRPSVGPYRLGVSYRVEEDDYRALAARWRRGERWAAVRGALPRPRTVHAVFSMRDPRPASVSASKLIAHRQP